MDQSDSPELSADFASNHMALVGGLATELEADSGAGNGPHPPTGGRPSSSHPVTRRTLAQGGPAMTQWKAALRQADGIAPGGSQGPHSEYIAQMLFTENGYLSPKDVVVRTLVFGDVSSHAYASSLAKASLSILRTALQRLRLSVAASDSSDPAHRITLEKIAKVKARIYSSSLTQVATNNVMLEAGKQSSHTPASGPVVKPPRKRHKPQLLY